ncbi:hypothetical protein EZV62_002083 [Acer yangbiense]|uniref:RNase H type-1 domain-containing protein n=1 Tax=Acer yangbiense TaxID=1000413 RepID=A0A5C7IX70_9ROSI|nr:hypothetical protein EZV62_002083 [Acer yangbiense]
MESLVDYELVRDRARRIIKPNSNAVGSVMYAMISTRLDLAQAISVLSRYMANPGYVDSNYTSDKDKRRSTSSYFFTIVGCCVSWKSQLQSVLALSTTEVEYIAVTEAIWLQGLLGDIKVFSEKCKLIRVSQDSHGDMATNAWFHLAQLDLICWHRLCYRLVWLSVVVLGFWAPIEGFIVVDTAEVLAILEGVQLAIHENLNPVIVESDKLTVINLCLGNSFSRCEVDTVVQDVKYFLTQNRQDKASICHGKIKSYKKILVLYTNYGKQKKPEKTNWVMHQYHLGKTATMRKRNKESWLFLKFSTKHSLDNVVEEKDGKLWIGSVLMPFVAVYNLSCLKFCLRNEPMCFDNM